MRRKRIVSEVNAGSMADIAFLLLIFFLVTTTITDEQGLAIKLPPWDPSPPIEINEERVLSILVNKHDEVLIEGLVILDRRSLTNRIQEYFDHLKGVKQPIISIHHDRGCSYGTYIHLYDGIKRSYNQAWNQLSENKFHLPYGRLSPAKAKEIRNLLPFVVSEAEPSNF